MNFAMHVTMNHLSAIDEEEQDAPEKDWLTTNQITYFQKVINNS